MNTLSFNVNNQQVLKLIQQEHDGKVLIQIEDLNGNIEPRAANIKQIFAGDMVMLVNYFVNCKNGTEKGDYIR